MGNWREIGNEDDNISTNEKDLVWREFVDHFGNLFKMFLSISLWTAGDISFLQSHAREPIVHEKTLKTKRYFRASYNYIMELMKQGSVEFSEVKRVVWGITAQ